MTGQFEYVALSDCIAQMIVLHEEGLLEDLHGVLRALQVVLPLHFKHLPESALAQDVHKLEGRVAEA